MPSAFDELFATAGFPDLLAQFGEPVTYTPRSGSAVAITAIITREPARSYEVNGKVITPKFLVRVLNDAALGIAVESLNTGGDKLSLLDRPTSSTATERTIVALLSSDSSVVEIAVN